MAPLPPDPNAPTLPFHDSEGVDTETQTRSGSSHGQGGHPVDQTLPQGFRLGRYELGRPLGAGASGVVYEAYDPELDRALAVKLMKSLSSEAVGRLRQEARALAKLSHPNVVQVYDVGGVETDGSPRVYVAMALLRGGTLNHWLQADDRTWGQILDVFIGAAHGLAAAHDAGLVHRDMKPENILLDARGVPKIVDFGLARPESPAGDVVDARLGAKKGQLIGSPAYMAPELFDGSRADAQSDQFSFCISFYEALYGRRPFVGETIPALISNVIDAAPAGPGDTQVPPSLHEIVVRGLSKEPSERWDSMIALASALVEERDRHRRRGRRRRRLGTGMAAATVVATVLGAWTVQLRPEDDCSQRGGIERVWNEQRAQDVGRGFIASGAPFGEDSWGRIVKAIDTYAADWTREQGAICGAHQAGEIADPAFHLRLACLHQRREELGSKLKLFERADLEIAERAAGAIIWLSPPRFCRFDASALSTLSFDGSEEPEAVQTARELIADSKAYRAAQQFDRALLKATESVGLLDTASELDEALLAEALVELGASQKGAGHRLEEIEALYLRAFDLAGQQGRQDLVALISNRMFGLSASQRRLEKAEQWRRRSIEAAATQPQELASALSASRLIHESQLSLADERPETAVEKLRQALETTEKIFGVSHPRTASLMIRLGRALNEAGDSQGSADILRRALVLSQQFYGEAHPAIFVPTNTLAFTLWSGGRREEAIRYFEQGLELAESSFPPNHPNRVAALSNFAGIQGAMGHFEAAIEKYSSALVRLRARPEPNLSHVATVLRNLGGLHFELEHFARSEAFYREALETLEALGLGDHTFASEAARGLGRSLARLGRFPEARGVYDRAFEIRSRRYGADHPRMASLHISLAASALDGGHREVAAEHLLRTEAFIEASEELTTLSRLRFERLMAELALLEGRHDEARARLETVQTEHRALAAGPVSTKSSAEERKATFALARALWRGDAAERTEALRLARGLLEALGETPPEHFKATKAEISDWLASKAPSVAA
ncbi:MAG: serine/threonine-protein kinase [Acidobacteriota bacterium]